MYSFLLFVLLYIPCLAATGVVFREIGKLYGTIFVGYLTLLGWSVSTIYHAVMVSGSGMWLIIGTGILVAMFGGGIGGGYGLFRSRCHGIRRRGGA